MAENKSRRKKREEPKGDAKADPVEAVEEGVPEETKPPAGGEASRAQTVKKMLAQVEEKMTMEPIKATLGDYIRLVQLHKELDEEEPKEIRVTWVEPETKE
jgi:hypothetical protein